MPGQNENIRATMRPIIAELLYAEFMCSGFVVVVAVCCVYSGSANTAIDRFFLWVSQR